MMFGEWESPIGFWSQLTFSTLCRWWEHDIDKSGTTCLRCGAQRILKESPDGDSEPHY